MNNNKIFYVLILTLGLINHVVAQPSFIWGKQFGTEHEDVGHDIVIYENGDLVLTGSSTGNLYSDNIGKRDGFIVKFDSLGNEIWKNQFGSDKDDKPFELEKDKSGNLYVAGITKGIINGEGHGNQDVLIYKYDFNGNLKATKIIGTDSLDALSEIYIDDEFNIYVAGNTKGKFGKNSYGNWDYFIMKLDSNFTELNTLQFGTEQPDICTDFIFGKEGDFYIGGYTLGNIGADKIGLADAFIAHYKMNGDLIRVLQFGTLQHDLLSNIIMDKNENIYISGASLGETVGGINGKSYVFVMKFDKKWDLVWEKQYGTKSSDEAWHMGFLNSENEILISGDHNPDAYIRCYDNFGNLKWNQVFSARGGKNAGKGGYSYKDILAGTGGRHFAIFKDKQIYFTGFTFADLFSKNPNPKVDDIFIVKLGLENK